MDIKFYLNASVSMFLGIRLEPLAIESRTRQPYIDELSGMSMVGEGVVASEHYGEVLNKL